MPKMSKRIILAALLVLLGTLKVGIIQGAVEPTAKPEYQSATVAESPITSDKWMNVVATSYSSRVQETSNHPFITASGTHVHQGTLAANWLPFGTKVEIPELFGDTIFTVEDRMNKRYDDTNHIDIWSNSTDKALQFGVKDARIEIF